MASLGRSLAVPNVQAPAATINGATTSDIPVKYIRPEAESEPVERNASYKLPVVYLQLLLDPEFCQEEFAKLQFACQEWGFFQLINHGVSAEFMQKVKEDAAEFFNLPLVEKEAVSQLPNDKVTDKSLLLQMKLDWAEML